MISVIVPIYNVEDCLSKCLDSLAAQTFTDAEFILIDDGSTDKSSRIADTYAKTDNRFSVHHTANHGLSAARNLGIEKAKGDWLMFVDSDDYVEPDFCDTPYQAALREGADLVIFRYSRQAVSQKNFVSGSRLPVVSGIVDAETALRYGTAVVWNKLYRRELFDAIRYPEGRVYEDVATTHKLIFAAKRILMLPDVLYISVPRKDSITHTHSSKNAGDAFLASLERGEYLKSHGCAEDLYLPSEWSRSLGFLARLEPGDDPLFQQAEAVADSIPGIPPQLTRKKKLMLLVWKLDKRLFHIACRLLGKKDNSPSQ